MATDDSEANEKQIRNLLDNVEKVIEKEQISVQDLLFYDLTFESGIGLAEFSSRKQQAIL